MGWIKLVTLRRVTSSFELCPWNQNVILWSIGHNPSYQPISGLIDVNHNELWSSNDLPERVESFLSK